MNIKSKNGFVGVDMTLAIIAIIIFSVLIVALMTSNLIEIIKTNKKALATVYMTEIMENIGIAKYEDVTQENIDSLYLNIIPKDIEKKGYKVKIEVDENLEIEEEKKEALIKKVRVIISYDVGNKNYECFMERLKVKE